jgi:hypothetical protein
MPGSAAPFGNGRLAGVRGPIDGHPFERSSMALGTAVDSRGA